MPQIARVWFGSTVAAKAEEYAGYLQQTGLKDLTSTPGNQGVLLLVNVGKETAEFGVISFWKSREAIKAFAGDDINKAVYYPEDRKFLLKLEPELLHFEVAAAEGFIRKEEDE